MGNILRAAMTPDDFDFDFGVTAGMLWADYLTDIEDERLGGGLLGVYLLTRSGGRREEAA